MLQVFLIHFVEGAKVLAVDVEDGDDVQIVEYGYDNLAAALGGTGDMTREFVDVFHELRSVFSYSSSAYALPYFDDRACRLSLKRSE